MKIDFRHNISRLLSKGADEKYAKKLSEIGIKLKHPSNADVLCSVLLKKAIDAEETAAIKEILSTMREGNGEDYSKIEKLLEDLKRDIDT